MNSFPQNSTIVLLGYLVSPAAKWMTGVSVRIDGSEIKGM
jgi:3-oxoacyl-[acyl-carrier protein] reductase